MARTQKGAGTPLVKLAQDRRIGRTDAMPSLTLSGKPVNGAYNAAIHLGGGYWAIFDTFPQGDQDEVIAELRALVSGTPAPEAADDEPVID